jgi:hypothetical protein
MTQQFDSLPSFVRDSAEEKHTSKFLAGLAFSFGCEENLPDYAKFYVSNQSAGYAFYKLKGVFEKIDEYIGVNSQKVTNSPWDYFSDVEALVTFDKKIIELTEKLQDSSEPLVVEKIRIVDRGVDRHQMARRIIDLEDCQKTFDGEILNHLKDRNRSLDSFLKAVYTERARKKASKRSTTGDGRANNSTFTILVDSNQDCDKGKSLRTERIVLRRDIKRSWLQGESLHLVRLFTIVFSDQQAD